VSKLIQLLDTFIKSYKTKNYMNCILAISFLSVISNSRRKGLTLA